MHSGKSVFILCGKHYIPAITRQFLSLQQRGKNHSQKLRWPSFLTSKLTNLPLIACWRLLHGVQSWAETLSMLSAGCGSLRLCPKLASLSNERPFKPSCGNRISYQTRPHKSTRFARAPIKTSPLTKRAIERRTLPRQLELFKARTSSPGQKNRKSFVMRLKKK